MLKFIMHIFINVIIIEYYCIFELVVDFGIRREKLIEDVGDSAT